MTLPLTPEILAATYDLLRIMPPFRGWRLPESDDVVFKVSHDPTIRGRYQWDGAQHIISVSAKSIGHTVSLVEAMAHEMVHVDDQLRGVKTDHGAPFRRKAAQVCKIHGFDPKLF